LRAAGASIIESIAAVELVRGRDVVEAMALVLHSEAWANVDKATEAMWAQFAEELEKDAEPGASRNGGPALGSGNSGAGGRPPSVS
jgi:hypothetical protein